MAVDYKIESNVPYVRPPPHGRKGESKYPFANMEAGDSFTFEDVEKRAVATAANYHGRVLKMTFSISGLRCWRIK